MATSNTTIPQSSLLTDAQEAFVCKGAQGEEYLLNLIGALLKENIRISNLILEASGGAPDPVTVDLDDTDTYDADGSIAAGKIYIEFIISTDFTGTINGLTFSGPTDAAYSLPLLPNGKLYPEISYTVTTGNLRITSF